MTLACISWEEGRQLKYLFSLLQGKKNAMWDARELNGECKEGELADIFHKRIMKMIGMRKTNQIRERRQKAIPGWYWSGIDERRSKAKKAAVHVKSGWKHVDRITI